jgi:hypothetical protein
LVQILKVVAEKRSPRGPCGMSMDRSRMYAIFFIILVGVLRTRLRFEIIVYLLGVVFILMFVV